MGIMLGNLSVKEIEERAGVEFPEKLIEFMNTNHQEKAENIKAGKWHCFDMPFNLVCGDMETASTIFDHIKDKSSDFKQQMQISVQQ